MFSINFTHTLFQKVQTYLCIITAFSGLWTTYHNWSNKGPKMKFKNGFTHLQQDGPKHSSAGGPFALFVTIQSPNILVRYYPKSKHTCPESGWERKLGFTEAEKKIDSPQVLAVMSKKRSESKWKRTTKKKKSLPRHVNGSLQNRLNYCFRS